MDIPTPNQNNTEEEYNQEKKESLSEIKKRLETGSDIGTDSIKEAKAQNLSQTRDILQNPSAGTIINVKQGKGVVNINTGTVDNNQAKKNIPSDFFIKQRGFSSSGVQYKGGRL